MILLEHVSVDFPSANGVIPALQDINLNIEAEILGLIGPSGSGKTTLLRVLAGLIEPTSGQVIYEDADSSYGIVFQDYSLLPWLSVRQNIEIGLKIGGMPGEDRRNVSERILRQIDLQYAAHLLPHQLSGGMRQRVAVGRAFAAPASLLLMDEPFGALDRFTREELQGTLNRLYMSQPHMVVFVTHDVEEALFLCDRICLLSPRPGTVREVVKVPFPRPRRLKVKREQRFIELKYEIEDKLRRHMLRGEK